MTVDIYIRTLDAQDVEMISGAFSQIGWNKPDSLFIRYLAEQERGERTTLVAFTEGNFAGYLTIKWQSDYPPFEQHAIPEIADLNVLPMHRRQGIGTRLMEQAERLVATKSTTVGIGVGMTADYGAAQRLYVKRGYVPDGRGLYQNKWLQYGDTATVNDALVLYLTKSLAERQR